MSKTNHSFKKFVSLLMMLCITAGCICGNIFTVSAAAADAAGFWVSQEDYSSWGYSGSTSIKLYTLAISSVENNCVSGIFVRNSTHFRDHGCKHIFENAPLINNSFTIKMTDVWTVPLSDENSSSYSSDERTFVITFQEDTINIKNTEGEYSENTLVRCSQQSYESASTDPKNKSYTDYSGSASVSSSSGGETNSEITVMVNGKNVESDAKPVIIDSTTFVPVRAVCEAMGCTVTWSSYSQNIYILCGDISLTAQIGNNVIKKNVIGKGIIPTEIECDMAPRMIDSSAYIPLRDIAEALGASVFWNAETKTISISI
ncbi:MAG: copper amine oxidase N-terminal domain-containing protein [Clostridiales bacterium]|nr:copper amine oxidase N-terminal domain-containing protein [Clostridiales bacterium]